MDKQLILLWGLFFSAIGSLTYFIAGRLRHYYIGERLLDIPNHRSSHSTPTPRGGGLAFIISFSISICALSLKQYLPFAWILPYISLSLLIALLGFFDDKQRLSAKGRLLSHFVIGLLSFYLLTNFPSIRVLGIDLQPNAIGYLLVLLYLVWMVNLYNFMDGINGLAAIETITVCISATLLFVLSHRMVFAIIPTCLAAAVLGFLIWNFPRARLFMGDIGSGYLGFTIALLSLQAALAKPLFFCSWLIFLGVFIVDATLTLLVRIYYRERIFEAHCNHAFQHAARWYGNHTAVSLRVMCINLLFLLPLGISVGLDKIDANLGILMAYLPLMALALYFNAGVSSKNRG